ncbi:pectinesterase family protein [Uliginosibacterium aquaticum]|uniref:Pectinesterase n=1 Tax=Uliginosibacterium aquaticum TaxID=2731212 RepID=A0ABX2IBX2_9RHOO|nr:pectinesterase family protein [Uliginosibacterium aquaticum]NSL53974.1 acyl-CoA thioesterase [Uliginosibacterium aquaticum]
MHKTLWLAAASLTLFAASASAANRPSGYVTLCSEGKTCTVATATNVAFGRSDQFFYKTLTGSFACSEATFGGRIAGGVNECSIPNGSATSSAASSSAQSSSAVASSAARSSVTSSAASSATVTSAASSAASSAVASSSGNSSWPASTSTRPQLSDTVAAAYDVDQYLAAAGTVGKLVTDNWKPRSSVVSMPATPDYLVAKSGATYSTVQAAITAATLAGKTTRQYIKVMPGTYNELVIVPKGLTVTLYGGGSDPAQTVIALPTAAKLTGSQYAALANPGSAVFTSSTPSSIKATYDACAAKSGSIGTTCSALFVVNADNFEATNLTIQNTWSESANGESQAVALMVVGDRNLFYKTRLIANQDTLYVKSTAVDVVARSYFAQSYIEGDTDFIFGRGTAVFDKSTIFFTRVRKSSSTIGAPSTYGTHPYGFLFTGCSFSADAGAATISLARQWPESSSAGVTIGKMIVRESYLSAEIKNPPWADWSSSNPVQYGSASKPYLGEYHNSGPGAAK